MRQNIIEVLMTASILSWLAACSSGSQSGGESGNQSITGNWRLNEMKCNGCSLKKVDMLNITYQFIGTNVSISTPIPEVNNTCVYTVKYKTTYPSAGNLKLVPDGKGSLSPECNGEIVEENYERVALDAVFAINGNAMTLKYGKDGDAYCTESGFEPPAEWAFTRQ